MVNRLYHGMAAAGLLAAVIGFGASHAVAQGKGSMHVAFGDTPDPEMLNFLAAVARAEERGVKVRVSYLASEDTAAQAVVSGQADIGVGTPYALIQRVKAPVRMFFQLAQMRFFPIVDVRKFKTWKDLDGADIVVHSRGSGTEAIMQLMARKEGISYRSISYVPGSSARATAMLQGRIHVTVVDGERKRLLMERGANRFAVLPLPELKSSDEALYANVNWLKSQREAVDVLVEELIKVWREINQNPDTVVAMRARYKLLPNLPEKDVSDIGPAFREGVEAKMYPNNGGDPESVKQDFEFFAASGALKGDPASLKMADFWYFEPLERAAAKLGRK